jgi:hypothetical protein
VPTQCGDIQSSLQAEDGKDERGDGGETDGEIDQHDESSSWMTLTVVGHCGTYLGYVSTVHRKDGRRLECRLTSALPRLPAIGPSFCLHNEASRRRWWQKQFEPNSGHHVQSLGSFRTVRSIPSIGI